jgi:hypothetical protein
MKSLYVKACLLCLYCLVLPACELTGTPDPEKSGAKAITAFVINGVSGTINEGAKTIGVTLPEGTGLNALAPVITVSEKAGVSPASGTERDFSAPRTYTVTAEDGTMAIYTVTVRAGGTGGPYEPGIVCQFNADIPLLYFPGSLPATAGNAVSAEVHGSGTDILAGADWALFVYDSDGTLLPLSGQYAEGVYTFTAPGTPGGYTVSLTVRASNGVNYTGSFMMNVSAAY